MSNNQYTGRRAIVTAREKLYRKQGGKCHWCKRQMKLNTETKPGAPPDPLMCTFDHIEDRWSDARGLNTNRNVAACRECNGKRSAERERAIITRDKNTRAKRDYIAECVGDRPPHAGALYTAGGQIP